LPLAIAWELFVSLPKPHHSNPCPSKTPYSVDEFVGLVNQTVRGWAKLFPACETSQTFRLMQCFIGTRFRRNLTFRSKGRGFG